MLGITDGCAKQCWCATALCFLTKVAHEFGITIDRAISAAGQGKSIVDALNGVAKAIVIQYLRRQVACAEEAAAEGSGKMKIRTVSGDEITSPAADAAGVLTQSKKIKKEGATGKWVNVEAEKQVENHHYHVRVRDEELMTSKCKTITFREKDTTFKGTCAMLMPEQRAGCAIAEVHAKCEKVQMTRECVHFR